MTADSPDIGDTTNALRKTPSRELELDFTVPHQSAGNAQPRESIQSDVLNQTQPEETTTCGICVKGGRFTTVDALFILGGMIMYIADLVTDLVVGVQYFREGYALWAIMTFIFVLLPSLVLQYFSFRWFVSDLDEDPEHKKKGLFAKLWSWCQWLFTHVLQLGAVKRYWRTLKFGLRSRRDHGYYKLMIYEYRDITMLRLLEAFMESAPQLVLQVYIMVESEELYWLTAASAIVSLSSLAWALEAYHKALRDSRADKKKITYYGVVLRITWRLFTITARVIALALFASIYEWWVFVVVGAHWVMMTLWLVWQQTDFCDTKFEEVLFDAVMGIIHIFCFFNMKEGRTRYRALVFYTIIFIENTIMFGLWYHRQESREKMYGLPALIFVWGGFFIGAFLMAFYYRFCHPTGKLPFCLCGVHDDTEDQQSQKETVTNHAVALRSLSHQSNGGVAGGDEVDGGGNEVDGCAYAKDLDGKLNRKMSERDRYYANLFSYKWRRHIHPELLPNNRLQKYVDGVVTAPPMSPLHPEMIDTEAVYRVDANEVSTQPHAQDLL
ncbi:XK-related protein 6-like [Lytechinus pictus]|uniref:XK-related protein 6-like n=1 Tax=Lytechinus pictus TaxID=7653 RepID=UPI0030B9FED3